MLTQEYVDNGGMGVHVTLRESLELSIYGPSSQGIPTLVPWMRSKWQGGRLGAQYSATVRNSICAVHWSRSRHSEDWKSVEGRREIERNSVGEGYDATTFDSRKRGWQRWPKGDDRASSFIPNSFIHDPDSSFRNETLFSSSFTPPSANSFLISWFWCLVFIHFT